MHPLFFLLKNTTAANPNVCEDKIAVKRKYSIRVLILKPNIWSTQVWESDEPDNRMKTELKNVDF
jgi:hypothetical protein